MLCVLHTEVPLGECLNFVPSETRKKYINRRLSEFGGKS